MKQQNKKKILNFKNLTPAERPIDNQGLIACFIKGMSEQSFYWPVAPTFLRQL